MSEPGETSGSRRDRLRELLDAVLDGADDGTPRTLAQMAGDAFTSPYHFNRMLSRGAGEPPVAMRRRVMLERSAWQLRHGGTVTDAAWAAGYESLEGFSRAFAKAFGHPPSTAAASHWLPAPNGIHFHPPESLWVDSQEQVLSPLTEQLVMHDLDDTRALLEQASGLSADVLAEVRLPGRVVLEWDGPEESLIQVLEATVWAKECWVASIEGLSMPARDRSDDVAALIDQHEAVGARWLAVVRDIERRGAWEDRLVDALCEPPESFQIGSVVAHVLTYAAHRRLLARAMLRMAGVEVDRGDPIEWLRARRGEVPPPTIGA
ncbi:DinB family protein [Nocardioides albertanoniae]|uniref:DinB family protein n=1 Tax=Nocardioides albertanoniae TaxID=1175486 RepID=A0A543ACK7_9ACTN|nr:helix-turn-helix transcriptional regulator [Nocardioides albertanoniae]TQL70325.1 DinB family protein [Nocardioides albertanoniae]